MEEKEIKIKDQPEALTMKQDAKIAEQQVKSLCRIKIGDNEGSGFLCRIPDAENKVLITCNHVLNQEQIKPGEEITIYFTNKEGDRNFKTIKIDESRTTYTINKPNGEDVDVTIIELRPDEDKLNDQEFIEIDKNLMDENVKAPYKGEDVYAILFKGKELARSTGAIK